jgi:pimeloyl-ACP methyl ester carboxylesterase
MQLEIFENCGHGVARDRPEVALPLIREFIAKLPA